MEEESWSKATAGGSPGRLVKLNVGGQVFQTTSQTLTQQGRENFFSALLSGRIPSVKDEQDAFFIDRPGLCFAPILEYLQTGEMRLPAGLSAAVVRREAAFYCIDLPEVIGQESLSASGTLEDVANISNRASMEVEAREEERPQTAGQAEDVTQVLLLIPLFNRPNAFDVYAHPLRISTQVCQLFMENSIAQLEQENRFSLLSWKTIAKVTSILLTNGWVPISVSFTNYLMDFKSGLVFTRKQPIDEA